MGRQKDVAIHLNLSEKQVQNLSKLPGAPVNIGRGSWDIDAWRYFYIQYLRARTKGTLDDEPPETAPEKDVEQRLKNEERQERILISRVKRRILAKRYAPIELITVAVSRTATELRTRVESWLPRLKKIWPDMPPEANELLQRELAEAINELAEIRVNLSDYDVGDIERDLDSIEAIENDSPDDWS